MIHVSQAVELLISSASIKKGSERVSLANALGRVASESVVSSIQIPPQDNSAMDGFAVNSIDASKNALSSEVVVSQRITAGSQPSALEPGTAARIFTGGVIPEGADAVIIQENCEFDSSTHVRYRKRNKCWR